jgi:hypothetical protein
MASDREARPSGDLACPDKRDSIDDREAVSTIAG